MPTPLTPPECDLRDFPFMPLQIQRLKQSRAWLLCKRNPALAFYLFNLWTAAWHNKPAASLDNDDLVLADLAMCSSDEIWAQVRADVLRGWVLCDDGRLYHPVVAEQATEAWDRKCAQRSRTEAARAARLASRQQGRSDVADIVTASVTENATEPVTGSKGQGQGQGQRQRESGGNSAAIARPVSADQTPSKPKRGRQIRPETEWPDGFALTTDLAECASKAGYDPPALFDKFRNKALAKGWTYKDWSAAFRTFVANERTYAPAPRTNGAWRPPDC